jgi:hypothetical protein
VNRRGECVNSSFSSLRIFTALAAISTVHSTNQIANFSRGCSCSYCRRRFMFYNTIGHHHRHHQMVNITFIIWSTSPSSYGQLHHHHVLIFKLSSPAKSHLYQQISISYIEAMCSHASYQHTNF